MLWRFDIRTPLNGPVTNIYDEENIGVKTAGNVSYFFRCASVFADLRAAPRDGDSGAPVGVFSRDESRGGTLAFLSGVGTTDERGALIAPGDFPGQVRATWDRVA